MTSIINISPDKISRRADARPLDRGTLDALEASIAEVGLINPIRVRKIGDSYEIVAGHHRFAACDLNGWTEIPCIVVDDDDVRAEMAMIAENLHRAELSKLERDEQVARWIELSGHRHPSDEPETSNSSTHQEVLRQLDAKPLGGRPEGGTRAAAREIGVSDPDARRAIKVASLSTEAKTMAREIGLDDNRSALLEAAKHSTPEAQVKALQDRRQGIAAHAEPKEGPTYEELRSAILFLADLKPKDYSRLCPPAKRAAMCQKLSHLERVFEQVREAVSA